MVGLQRFLTGEHLVSGSLPARSGQNAQSKLLYRRAKLKTNFPSLCPPSLVKARLSSRAACRKNADLRTQTCLSGRLTCRTEADWQTQTCLTGAFTLSQVTRKWKP
ncbi:hypothetical protein [Spirosoma areae]